MFSRQFFVNLPLHSLDQLGASRLGRVRLETVDITLPQHEKWFNRFRYEIPVFYLDGKFLCKNRIDLELFDRELKKRAEKVGQVNDD